MYVVLGILGDVYLFYVGHHFILNHYLLRGSLIILVSLGLVYWLYVNFYYYFFDRQAPFDVSAPIEKKLGLRRFNRKAGRSLNRIQNLPHEHLFIVRSMRHTIPAKIKMTTLTRTNLQQVANMMRDRGQLRVNYDGMSQRQITQYLQHHERVYAIGAGALIPYFSLRQNPRKALVYAGSSYSTRRLIGRIDRVGWQTVPQLIRQHPRYHLKLVSVVLMGGPYWSRGRSHFYQYSQKYTVQINVKLELNR